MGTYERVKEIVVEQVCPIGQEVLNNRFQYWLDEMVERGEMYEFDGNYYDASDVIDIIEAVEDKQREEE